MYLPSFLQAPESGPESELFGAVQGIMEASAQSIRLTRLSGRRDMSTLLAQSAFSVRARVSPGGPYDWSA